MFISNKQYNAIITDIENIEKRIFGSEYHDGINTEIEKLEKKLYALQYENALLREHLNLELVDEPAKKAIRKKQIANK